MGRYGYSRWDGTQAGFRPDADEVLAEVTDDLLYHGDATAALRRLLQDGMERPEGRLAGLRELLDRLRRRRQELLDRHQLGGAFDDVAEELDRILGTEREELGRLEEQAARSGDQRRQEVTGQAMAERRLQLDLLPPDLAGRVRALRDYDFTSAKAQQRFEQLLDRLREELLQRQFNRMSEAMRHLTPEDLQRLREMFSALNDLLELRAAGEDTADHFAAFMEQFGDFFPGRPRTLEELLEQLAAQMAAGQALLNSMTPAQRAQLHQLSDQLLGDFDLGWQVDRLRHNLQQALPGAGWDRSYQFGGDDPLGLGEGAAVLEELGELADMEQFLRGASSPGALADVDLERARRLLGPDAAEALERLEELGRELESAGLVENREGRLELTPRGLRRLGHNALGELFSRLSRERFGGHPVERTGAGQERAYETKPYEFGDPFELSIERTVRNAVARQGAGVPVHLTPDDFEVERTETLTRAATVLALDLSLSMPIRDNFLAAKKVAMALHALISSQFPRDYLGLVGFGKIARPLPAARLPEVSWDLDVGTNLQHALTLGRRLLAGRAGTRQIIVVTDGEPTAHLLPDGTPFFSYPPAQATVDATLMEVNRCTREGIRINTFMLDATPALTRFVELLTELNRGRAFFTTPETLGDYVLVDFLDQRRATRAAGRRRPRRPA